MQNWLKALIAGFGAKKLGGGCLSTILIFIVIYYALGQCNPPATPARQGKVNTQQQIKTAHLDPSTLTR